MSTPHPSPPPPIDPVAAPNTYTPPAPPPKPILSKYDPSSEGLQYLYLYGFIFESAQWILNLLFVTLCSFIPVVGYIVMMGYQLTIIERLHLRPTEVYPDFDFDCLGDYLKRGVWPFLIFLIIYIVCMPFMLVLFNGPMFLLAMVGSSNEEIVGVVAAITVPLVILLISVGVLLMVQFLVPIFLRAGLTQDVRAAWNWRFIRDFVRRVWLEVLLGHLFLFVTYVVLIPLGMLCFIVGTYFVMAMWMMAQGHLLFQVYHLYLQRGGERIPLATAVPPIRPEMVAVVPPGKEG
jgi:hypothetical protein